MPPVSNIRKSSTATTTVTHVNDMGPAPRRTTSGRAVRANTTRPTNYYARPFGSFSAAAAANTSSNDAQDTSPPGFFPALQFFSDAITALPKEVMRQFTLLKEVEAKIHGPNEELGQVVDALMEYPVPSRRGEQVGGQGMLSLTASNSVIGSTSASVVNGVAPNVPQLSAQTSVAGSVSGEEAAQVGHDEDVAKRQKFHELRMLTQSLLANLDEKNVVLAEANRVLAQQLSRVDSVLPHIDNEISEEARLGSMTHWAYSDNRQKKQLAGSAANRRDVAATNSLAAAASAIHESDIAAARRDTARETIREKHKGRAKEHVDSDFDDKPKKARPKFGKDKNMGAAGLGISNVTGEPVKKRRVDKGLVPPAMERTQSTAAKGSKAAKETPRSTPAAEPVKKVRAKPAPLPAKRKGLNSSHPSPALASSPLHSSFNVTSVEPSNARAQSARLRQNSTATNLRHENLAGDNNASRPTTSSGKAIKEKTNGKRKAPDETQEQGNTVEKTTEAADGVKHEDTEMADNERERVHQVRSRSASESGKAGRGSKNGTPRTEKFPDLDGPAAMFRTRSTRSLRTGTREGSSSEPQSQGVTNRHKRVNSHLVKQLAPFNRSPDLDRHKSDKEDDADSVDGEKRETAGEGREPAAEEELSPRKRSRRNTAAQIVTASSPPVDRVSEPGDQDVAMADAEDQAPEEEEAEEEEAEEVLHEEDVPSLEPSPAPEARLVEEEDVSGSEPGDPDDPNEPKYCYCNRGSYGEMIACDNEQCPREWFHLGCTELREPPEEEEKWYCKECRPLFNLKKGRGKGRGGMK